MSSNYFHVMAENKKKNGKKILKYINKSLKTKMNHFKCYKVILASQHYNVQSEKLILILRFVKDYT